MESAYATPSFRLSELAHEYGERVHVLGDPFALTLLARLCDAATGQPEFNQLVRQLYSHLLTGALNAMLPTRVVSRPTRMADVTERAVFRGALFDDRVDVVSVDIARAGFLPSQVCYDMLNTVLDPRQVRQDHLIVSRRTDANGKVVGADIAGDKIGGTIDGAIVLVPDPMGATGGSLATLLDHYHANHGQAPRAIASLNLIVTPQFIRRITREYPHVEIFALRVDRGLSADDIFATRLGERWDEENGLTDIDYIVPGGGGFGELMNNSYV